MSLMLQKNLTHRYQNKVLLGRK
ncbi:Protein of unknown function [Leuconostoc citreum LBAE C11]|nr:Protein of unknown function [Leuconostoc citreum LBAE C11]